MIETYKPVPFKKRSPGRPKMTEEEKEIARIKRFSLKVKEQKRKSLPRKNKLRLLKSPFVEFPEKKGQRFKGKLIHTMSREEAIKAVNYLLQALELLNEKHKETILELIGIK